MSPAARIRSRLASRPEARSGAAEEEGRIERLQARLAREVAGNDDRSILERLERLGITPGDTAIPDDGTGSTWDEERYEPLVLGRIYSLELVRYLLVLATAACAGASAWFVSRSIEVGELVGGEIAPSGLDRLDVARLMTVRALAVMLGLVPLWCAVAAGWANRVGMDVPGAVRCAALTVVSAALVVFGIVADTNSDLMGFVVTACLGAALWSIPVMIEVERRFGRNTTIPSLLPLALGSSVLIAWTGRLFRPVRATDSLEAMSFAGGLMALISAIAVVVVAVSSGDVVEAVTLSPATANPDRRSDDDPTASTA